MSTSTMLRTSATLNLYGPPCASPRRGELSSNLAGLLRDLRQGEMRPFVRQSALAQYIGEPGLQPIFHLQVAAIPARRDDHDREVLGIVQRALQPIGSSDPPSRAAGALAEFAVVLDRARLVAAGRLRPLLMHRVAAGERDVDAPRPCDGGAITAQPLVRFRVRGVDDRRRREGGPSG